MMEPNFSQPSRQSNYAVILIIAHLYKSWIKRFLPILIGAVWGTGKANIFFVVLGVFVVILAIFGLLSFLKYTFYVTDNELVIKKGVFKKSQMIIPFDRIQSINFKQTILHQAFGVVELEIDTAGSTDTEFELRAIKKSDATALRQIILVDQQIDVVEDTHPADEVLFELSFWDLLKVGLTQNHFRSGLIPIGLYFWLKDILKNGGINLDDLAEQYANPERVVNMGFLILSILLIGYVFVSIIISLVLSIIRFYNLTFLRIEDGFKVRYGLLTKRQISIKDSKIQIFRWNDNLLRKIPKIFHLQIKQAATTTVNRKTSSINLAGVSRAHIQGFLHAYFGTKSQEVTSFQHISPWWIRRIFVILLILSTIFFSLAIYFQEVVLWGVCLLLLYLGLRSWLFSRKRSIGLNDEIIHLKGGQFGDSHAIIQTYKLQGVQLVQSPYQRRKQLATIILFTAAGNQRIPYLDFQYATKLRDYVLQIVETDTRQWM